MVNQTAVHGISHANSALFRWQYGTTDVREKKLTKKNHAIVRSVSNLPVGVRLLVLYVCRTELAVISSKS